MPRFRQTAEILKLMAKKDAIRNVGIIAHIDHGKTTMTDSLLVEAGLLSPQVAGSARVLDYLEEEQKRGITIKTANISLLHDKDGHTYLINLVDTPGHVDFAGKVTRALRAIDGAIVVVDAVEEIMAQTETVTRQALEERVKPVLFINKLDRLIEEMRLSPAEIQNKLTRIIADFNSLIENYAEPEFREKWKVDAERESVVFGSALHKWGFTLKTAREKGLKLGENDFAGNLERIKHQTLSRLTPLHGAILDMVVENLPSPIESQPYRVPKIWKGENSSEIGQAMLNCDDKGPTVMCITMAQAVPKTGLVVTGRLFSGSVREGQQVYVIEAGKEYLVKQVSIYMGAFREAVSNISAGNIAALSDLGLARAGNTLIDCTNKGNMVPFEQVRYLAEPVMTVTVEPRKPIDLPKVAEAMDRLSIEDPNLLTRIDEETGQYLISGIGELHLEIAVNSLRQYLGNVELTVSNPISAYRETVLKQGKVVMARTSNRRNEFWVETEPLKEGFTQLIESGAFSGKAGREKTDGSELENTDNLWAVDKNGNILLDLTEEHQNIQDTKASIVRGFCWACGTGALCEQPLRGVKIKLIKMQLDPDPCLREPTHIARATSRAILGSFLTAKPILLEPIYKIDVSVKTQWLGTCINIISRRRGKILGTEQKGLLTTITGCIPVAETFDMSAEMRSATSGYAFWQFAFDHWEEIPENLARETIKGLRKKRGLPEEVPTPKMFADEA